jgi:hypothetical protein
VGDSTRKVGVSSKDAGHVNRIVITRNLCVGLVGRWGLEEEWSLSVERNGIFEVDGLFNGGTMSLEVVDNWVSVRNSWITSLVGSSRSTCPLVSTLSKTVSFLK